MSPPSGTGLQRLLAEATIALSLAHDTEPADVVDHTLAATRYRHEMTSEELIERAGRALAAAAPPASRVILFGSHARGDTRAGSDLDFLVIEPDADHSGLESVRLRRALRELPASIDVVVVSRDVAERRSKVPGTMVDRALREGRVIAGP